MFAPDVNQMHVINHLTGSPAEGQSRYLSLSLFFFVVFFWFQCLVVKILYDECLFLAALCVVYLSLFLHLRILC